MGNKFHKDTAWMKIQEVDLNVVDELLELEHPLKKVPLKLIFSDLIYFVTCQKRKTKRTML